MEENKPVEEQKPLVMTITLSPNNDFKIECPVMNNQLFCLGLLEQAKLCVIQYNAAKAMEKQRIVKPNRIFGAFGK